MERIKATGASNEATAYAMGFSPDTLTRHYAAEVEHGREQTNLRIGSGLIRAAEAGDVTAARFYLQACAGWKITSTNEQVGKNGGPIRHAAMTVEEMAAAEKAADEAY